MATWITRLEAAASQGLGLRVAVKDAIDVAGVPTTVGCKALADRDEPPVADAACLAGTRSAGARVVGKANLHELCYGTTGLNSVFGNPVNPRWPDRVPGGSSSGSAVAVADDEADIGFGTDTGGSIRLPAACCGIVGLKTTWGRVSLDGVWPLAPSLDTVGPLARDVRGIVAGMALLEPGFTAAGVAAATRVGRLRPRHVTQHPDIERAVDGALAAAGFEVVEVELPGLQEADLPFGRIIGAEAWTSSGHLIDIPGGVAEPVRTRLAESAAVTREQHRAALQEQLVWAEQVAALLTHFEVLALPTLAEPPSFVTQPIVPNVLCHPFNLARVPAISLPVGRGPGESLQIVGPHNGEALLCATAAVVEEAVS